MRFQSRTGFLGAQAQEGGGQSYGKTHTNIRTGLDIACWEAEHVDRPQPKQVNQELLQLVIAAQEGVISVNLPTAVVKKER